MAEIIHIKPAAKNIGQDIFPECALGSGNGTGSASMCASHGMRAEASPFPELEGKHPCFSMTAEGHARHGRLHLPVSPGCNITCRFCKRDYSNLHDHRPGVSNRVLTPEDALKIVQRALELCPSINVVGIAGPGDTLVSDNAIRTFKLIHETYPDLINCVSTNGLLLAEKAGQLVTAGVRTITVTVNAVDAKILERVCSSITYQGQRLTGEAAARRLIANQLLGIRRAVDLGAVVKVNTVLVPGVNEGHTGEVARVTAQAGASLINVIPLIPQHEFASVPPPTDAQLEQARKDASQYITVFSHCQRCRADACGIPGVNEFAGQLYESDVLATSTFSHG